MKTRSDPDARVERPDDYRFLLTSGPFPLVSPGRTLHYRVAMVVGNGMDEMLRVALRASRLQRGRWFNLDGWYATGAGGAETKVCLGDLPRGRDGLEPLFRYRAQFMDEACTGSYPIFGIPRITRDVMFEDEDGRTCIWVNGDNCEECRRAVGRECTEANGLYWQMGSYVYGNSNLIYTGLGGRDR